MGKTVDEDNNIMKLRQIKWRTTLSKNIDTFRGIISDDDVFNKYFGERYIEKLTEKSREITRTTFKLAIAYTVLMLSLFASQNMGDSDFEVFGYGFKNISKYTAVRLRKLQ